MAAPSGVSTLRKDAGLYCGPRLRKGDVFAYVGLPQNLKDLKDLIPVYDTISSPDRLRVGWLNEGVLREQKMRKGHLPRAIYHQVYKGQERSPMLGSLKT